MLPVMCRVKPIYPVVHMLYIICRVKPIYLTSIANVALYGASLVYFTILKFMACV